MDAKINELHLTSEGFNYETSLAEQVSDLCDETKSLFAKKNKQYGHKDDEYANFRAGANLHYGRCELPEMFEELKNYCRKHVAFVDGADIREPKVEESLRDIIVYSMIAITMIHRQKSLDEGLNRLHNVVIEAMGDLHLKEKNEK